MNMAIDRAVQLAHAAGDVGPTLRIYRWIRPTVTLGRFQKTADVDLEFCDTHGIDVVRRFTGGRGVLHDDEVTYAMVAGVSDGVPRGVSASYRMLCAGLAEAYRLLGVDAALTSRPRGERGSPACYLHATAADLSLGAMKLSGSAQVWSGSTVMQHGSFTITRDVDRECRVFRLKEDARRELAASTVTLADAMGRAPSIAEVTLAAGEGISSALGIRLEPGVLTQAERRLATQLLPQVACDYHAERLG